MRPGYDRVGRWLIILLLAFSMGFACLHTTASAQSWEDDVYRSVTLHDAGQLDSALLVARRAIDEAIQTPGLADTIVASLCLNHGAIAWEAGQYVAAESTLEAADAIWGHTPPTPEQIPGVIDLWTVLGRVKSALGKDSESVSVYEGAIQLTEAYIKPPYEMLGGLYWELAQALQVQQQYEPFDSALAASARNYQLQGGLSQRTVRAYYRLACARGLHGDFDSCYAALNLILPALKEGVDTLSADDRATLFEIINRVDPLLYEGRTDLRPTSCSVLELVISGATNSNPPERQLSAQARVVLGGYQEAEHQWDAAVSTLTAALADYALIRDSSNLKDEIVSASLLSTALTKLGEYNRADSILTITNERYHPIIVGSSDLTMSVLGSLAESCDRLGKNQDGIEIRLEMEKALQPDADPYVQNERVGVLHSLASSYLALGQPDQAREYCEKAIDLGHTLQEQQQLTEHDAYLAALDILGALEFSRGWLGALGAEPIHREAMDHASLVYGENSPQYARYLGELGSDQLAFAKEVGGDFGEAEQNLLKALQILASSPNVGFSQTFTLRLSLTILYVETGRLVEADKAAGDMMHDAESDAGSDSTFLAGACQQVAALKVRFGQNEEALQLYKRAYEIELAASGPDSAQTVEACSRLGEHCLRMSQISDAKKYMLEAYQAAQRSGNQELIASCMLPMADVFMSVGHYATVDSSMHSIIRYERSQWLANSDILSPAIWKLGLAKWHLGQLDTALALANEALRIESVNDKSSYLNLAAKYQHVGRLYEEKGMVDSALACFDKSWKEAHERYAKNWMVLSESDAIKFVEEFRRLSAGYLNLLCALGLNQRTIPKAVNIIIADKGIVSDGVMARAKGVQGGSDPAAQAVVAKIKEATQRRSRLYVSGLGAGADSPALTVDSLNREIDHLESELARLSAASLKKNALSDVSPESLLASLPERTTLVDFVRVDHRDSFNDSLWSRYLALVLRKGEEPTVVDLGEAGAIDAAVAAYRRHMEKFAAGVSAMVPIDSLAHRKRSYAIFEKVWRPLASLLGDAETVMIAPDGALNVVSFAALQDSSGAYLIEKFALHYLPASRDLLRMQESAKQGRGLLAFGDPDYNAPMESRLAQLKAMTVASTSTPASESESGGYRLRNTRSSCGSLATLAVDSLPATAREVQRLVESWRSRQSDSALTFLGAGASEDNVKQYAPGKEVIHIATHGFYLEGVCDEGTGDSSLLQDDSLAYRENPLLRSGLLLAGANLHGSDAGSRGDDGILTADEVAQLNLDGVRLVVLSACETGLGEIQQGEGVYGLRRAFLIAGARTVVTSLWPVPDEQTAEMMSHLYSVGDKPLATRLREAQLAQIKAIRDSHGIDHPYTWAAFIAIGDWR